MVEHAAVNRRVVGSSPTRGAVRLIPPPQNHWKGGICLFWGGTRSRLRRQSSRTGLSEVEGLFHLAWEINGGLVLHIEIDFEFIIYWLVKKS